MGDTFIPGSLQARSVPPKAQPNLSTYVTRDYMPLSGFADHQKELANSGFLQVAPLDARST